MSTPPSYAKIPHTHPLFLPVPGGFKLFAAGHGEGRRPPSAAHTPVRP